MSWNVGLEEAARAVLRWLWVVCGCVVIGAGVPWLLINENDDHRAIARIALTEQVEWPFFDSVRHRVSALADETDPQAIVAELGLDGNVETVTVTMPEGQAFLNVEAVADDPATAVAAADAYARELVAIERQRFGAYEENVAAIDRQLEELEAERSVLEADIDRLIELEAAAEESYNASENDPTALAEYRAYQDDLNIARLERDQIIRRQGDLRRSRDEWVPWAAGELHDVDFLRAAALEEAPAARSGLRVGLGAVVGATLGVIAAMMLDREYGRVFTGRMLGAVSGVPVLDVASVGWDRVGLRLGALAEARGSSRIGLVGDHLTAAEAASKMARLGDSRPLDLLNRRSDVPGSDAPRTEPEYIAVPPDDAWLDRGASRDDVFVLVAERGRTRIRDLQRGLDAISLHKIRLDGAMLVPKRRARSGRWRRRSVGG